MRTSDFTSPTVQSGLSAAELLLPINNSGSGTAMPAWVGKFSVEENFEAAGRLFMPDGYLSSAIQDTRFRLESERPLTSVQPCPWWRR